MKVRRELTPEPVQETSDEKQFPGDRSARLRLIPSESLLLDSGAAYIGKSKRVSSASQSVVSPHYFVRVAVRLQNKLILVSLSDVFWIQSRGNLLRLHLRETHYDCRMTMKDLLKHLDPDCFLRVHRNAIVNLDYVVEFDLPHYGNAYVQLRDGKMLAISRTGRIGLRRRLQTHDYSGAHLDQAFEG
jgi:DNA-binding LytR/AlgR family response regulator